MKKISFIFPFIVLICISACNNNTTKSTERSPKEIADSLQNEVLAGHDVTMPKSMKIPDLQADIKRMIDSIEKLPAKAREAATPYKDKLESLNKELGDAYSSMENWMEAFGTRLQELESDSLKNNFEEKIKYYSQEKLKIDKIKEEVLGSVEKAQEFLKAKS